MSVSKKCQYALRAVFELARRSGCGPVRISELASSQAIPVKFLELILCQLKEGGFVDSRRGRNGGYLLAVPPDELAVGEIIRFVDNNIDPVKCIAEDRPEKCSLHGKCAFLDMWGRARKAVAGVYDQTTFADMVAQHGCGKSKG